ncbi:MAG TPA: adenylate/guanylate cyclase domain-containing protein [Rectinemataceae bacterium]|nr:adenylate/guanylate cyclase domain-containing protein [Rectinemataceae bacterium]
MSRTSLVTTTASADRLERLIRARLEPGADKERIDAHIWDLFGEDWAVMFTDLSGFSRRVAEFGIIHFLQVIYESERILIPIIEEHDGILLKVEGDSFLVIFRNAQKALQCSIAMQASLEKANVGRAPENRILLCVGLGAGAMLRIGDADVFGAEVNAASKLGEDTAKAGEILVTDAFRARCQGEGGVEWEALAEAPPGATGAWRANYKVGK